MTDVPALTPVTRPVALIVATPGDTLLHTPPAATSVNWLVAAAHSVVVPVIVPALRGLTLTNVVAAAVPQLLVTV